MVGYLVLKDESLYNLIKGEEMTEEIILNNTTEVFEYVMSNQSEQNKSIVEGIRNGQALKKIEKDLSLEDGDAIAVGKMVIAKIAKHASKHDVTLATKCAACKPEDVTKYLKNLKA